jgi:hypothetical protein
MTYTDLASYCEAHPHLKKQYIASLAGIKPARFSKLKSRKYGLRPTPEEAKAIARLLNQPVSHVRKLYALAA